MSEQNRVAYFLGANAPAGFYSLYDQLICPEQARAVYILKGGPGCGKSTLMGRVAAALEGAGEQVEYIHCSGDPQSLDGVVFPWLGAAIVDGTAPHGADPKPTGNLGIDNWGKALWFGCRISGCVHPENC